MIISLTPFRNMKKKITLNTYRVAPTNNWNNVTNFSEMWWHLPWEPWIFEWLSEQDKDRLIGLCLDTIWRKTDDLQYSIYIEKIQDELMKAPRIKKYIETWDSSLTTKDL